MSERFRMLIMSILFTFNWSFSVSSSPSNEHLEETERLDNLYGRIVGSYQPKTTPSPDLSTSCLMTEDRVEEVIARNLASFTRVMKTEVEKAVDILRNCHPLSQRPTEIVSTQPGFNMVHSSYHAVHPSVYDITKRDTHLDPR